MEYVYFDTEEQANTFLLDCIDRGIYAKRIYIMGLPGVEIDIERTFLQKNAGYDIDIVQETLDRR